MRQEYVVYDYEGWAALMARRVKDAYDKAARDEVAPLLARWVKPGSVIVPAPSSSGQNPAMFLLAREVARLSGSVAAEAVIRARPVQSSHLARRANLPTPSLEEHIASMKLGEPLPSEGIVYLLDNVITSGKTLQAMQAMLHLPDDRVAWLAYAQSPRGKRNPVGSQMRVCVCGSRGFADRQVVVNVLMTLPPGVTIVHGGARGADQTADSVARAMGLPTEVWLPDWKRYGRAAGPLRNRAMVGTCEVLIAFWDGHSRGTADALRVAKALGLEYEVIPVEGQ